MINEKRLDDFLRFFSRGDDHSLCWIIGKRSWYFGYKMTHVQPCEKATVDARKLSSLGGRLQALGVSGYRHKERPGLISISVSKVKGLLDPA